MGKVRSRSDNGKLFLDFYFQGVRCREQTTLTDTPANRRKVQKLLERIELEISEDRFDYAATFPGSTRALQFSGLRSPAGEFAQPAARPTRVPRQDVDRTPRFREFSEIWMREKEPEWRPSYLETVTVTLNGYLLPAFGNRRVGSITRADLLAFRADLAKRVRPNGKTLSNARINKIMGFARQILNEVADRYDFASPYRGIKSLRSRKPDIHPFSLDEVNLILERVRPDYRHYLAVRFYTGMRSGEVNGLRWHNVDFANGLILVRETLVQGRLQEGTKTFDSNRDIPMLPPVRQALEAQRKLAPKDVEWVFCTRNGYPIENRNFTKRVWKPLLANLGLAYRRPYQTRHTAATLMLAAGESPEWVARVLGHTTTQMLFTTYSRYVPNLTRQDGSAMARLLASGMNTAPDKPTNSTDGEPT
jgi:integrase